MDFFIKSLKRFFEKYVVVKIYYFRNLKAKNNRKTHKRSSYNFQPKHTMTLMVIFKVNRLCRLIIDKRIIDKGHRLCIHSLVTLPTTTENQPKALLVTKLLSRCHAVTM